ncbi:LLM class F420-dependent oxidoreductase [Haloactinomyces albus]|uniref:F420-dependent oxidoreductase n=1 Tax=Haloactinomyces albus TaxID=1352928 RepID=A0AAE4CKH7_9ACTN|nr:LLM class F420-dependent oxidoreductase [Haloactinomyces albus]MDR7300356.1 putative F420-dependent oxidoreductase [Haloactinomyces albus]
MAVDIGSVGLWTPSWDWNPDSSEHREAIAELDTLGYGALWLGAAGGDLALVSGLLDASERIVVATGIVNIWTHDAAELAAVHDRLSTAHLDRLLIGVGTSHAPAVEAAGHSYSKPYSKLVSFLDELDAAEPALLPESRVLAALGPRTLALAGERARGAHPYLTTPEHTANAREILGAGPLLAPEQKVVLAANADRARSVAREGVAPYLTLPNYLNNLRRLGFTDADFAEGGSDRLIDAVVAWGDLETVVSRIREHHEAGADHVSLQVLTGEAGLPREQWRRLSGALA